MPFKTFEEWNRETGAKRCRNVSVENGQLQRTPQRLRRNASPQRRRQGRVQRSCVVSRQMRHAPWGTLLTMPPCFGGGGIRAPRVRAGFARQLHDDDVFATCTVDTRRARPLAFPRGTMMFSWHQESARGRFKGDDKAIRSNPYQPQERN